MQAVSTGLKGKRVLVTGAASGIGAATCSMLAREGCLGRDHAAAANRQPPPDQSPL